MKKPLLNGSNVKLSITHRRDVITMEKRGMRMSGRLKRLRWRKTIRWRWRITVFLRTSALTVSSADICTQQLSGSCSCAPTTTCLFLLHSLAVFNFASNYIASFIAANPAFLPLSSVPIQFTYCSKAALNRRVPCKLPSEQAKWRNGKDKLHKMCEEKPRFN